MATKLITELLTEINQDPSLIEKYKTNGALKYVFEYSFDPTKKFVLPEGIPPYKQDPAPIGMTPGNLYMELRKLYIFCRTDLNALRRESLFIQLLENVHPDEAKLILAIKDQELTKMYPNITHKLVYDVGLITVPPTQEQVAKVQKPKKAKAPKDGAKD